ncbi:MAG TPA: beta-propeller domain-containing protein [Labilithrix sp.]|nr:beta-propeller domain-containing protein [Labilithrix sp.]
MRVALCFVSAFALASLATGCHFSPCSSSMYEAAPRDSASKAGAPSNAGAASPTPTGIDASRTVLEADVVQLDHEQNRIYAMSRSGSLAVVDAATAGRLTLLGKTALSGEPFEMYRRGNVLLAMSNRGTKADGSPRPPLADGAPLPAEDPTSSALITALDVSDPANARQLMTFKVAGEIADSRIVGDVLYLATYENGQCYGCTGLRTLVTTFDISNATAPRQVDQVTFESSSAASLNLAWATPWKRSIIATAERLYVGGLGSNPTSNADEGVVEVLDITDPGGKLTRGAQITTSGPVMSRWQMDEHEGVLRVISQRGAGRSSNGEAFPDVDTFRIESTTSMPRVGHATITLPRQEGLKTVRFDGTRAYAITFNQTDPLFAIDLSDAAHPAQKGELHMPGWMYYLEPHGERVIGLGLDRTDQAGNLNVTLFDVSDLSAPKLVQRVSFGPSKMYEDYMITNGALAEDQDRIQKAFRVFDDGLIAIPFSGGGSNGDSCSSGGVQLVDWTPNSLTKQALLPMKGNARRAIRRDSAEMKELLAVSDSNVTSFQIDRHDESRPVADVVIGTCVARTLYPTGGFNGGGWGEGNDVLGGEGSDYSSNRCE